MSYTFRTPAYIAEKIEGTMRDPELIKIELNVLENYRLGMDKAEKILSKTPMSAETDTGFFGGIDDMKHLAEEFKSLKRKYLYLQNVMSKTHSAIEFDSNKMDEALYPDDLDWTFEKPTPSVPYSVVYIIQKEDEEEEVCSICAETITGYGNNAMPINDGRCCDECNSTKVIPARLAKIESDDEDEYDQNAVRNWDDKGMECWRCECGGWEDWGVDCCGKANFDKRNGD